jgi:hypothetical protein
LRSTAGGQTPARGSGFADHRHRHRDDDVVVQRDLDVVLAHGLQRAIGQPNHRFFDGEVLLAQRLGDVEVGDRAEQAAIDAGLLRDLDRQALELLALGCAAGLFALTSSSARRLRILIATGSATRCPWGSGNCGRSHLDLDDIAQRTEVLDF